VRLRQGPEKICRPLLLVFLGGIARLASIAVVGMPGSIPGVLIISTVLIAELLLMPALLWWQRRVMQRRFQ
jgi:hypothetical protein